MRSVRVTRALTVAGLVGDYVKRLPPEAKERGTLVHDATVLWDRGKLASMDSRLEGWLDAYIAFRSAFPFPYVLTEERIHDPILRFNGQIDRVALDDRRKIVKILDVKTGPAAPWHAIQLAAYQRLARLYAQAHRLGWAEWAYERHGVYLTSAGTFTTVPYTAPDDWAVFLACLTLYRFHLRTKAHGEEDLGTSLGEVVRGNTTRSRRRRAASGSRPGDVRNSLQEPPAARSDEATDHELVR